MFFRGGRNLNTFEKKNGNFFLFKNIRTFIFFLISIFLFFYKKFEIFFLTKMLEYILKNPIFFFQMCSNLHERCGIGWIKRKIKFQIFPIFIFRVMVIFGYFCSKKCPFSKNFYDTPKIKIEKLIFYSFQHITHLSWKWDQN